MRGVQDKTLNSSWAQENACSNCKVVRNILTLAQVLSQANLCEIFVWIQLKRVHFFLTKTIVSLDTGAKDVSLKRGAGQWSKSTGRSCYLGLVDGRPVFANKHVRQCDSPHKVRICFYPFQCFCFRKQHFIVFCYSFSNAVTTRGWSTNRGGKRWITTKKTVHENQSHTTMQETLALFIGEIVRRLHTVEETLPKLLNNQIVITEIFKHHPLVVLTECVRGLITLPSANGPMDREHMASKLTQHQTCLSNVLTHHQPQRPFGRVWNLVNHDTILIHPSVNHDTSLIHPGPDGRAVLPARENTRTLTWTNWPPNRPVISLACQ